MLQTILDWWSRWARGWLQPGEMDVCAPSDIARIASDLKMTVPELRQVAAAGDAELLLVRLRERGLEPERIAPRVLRDLQRCCGTCASTVLCSREVDAALVPARWPDYCPNQATVDALMLAERH